MSNESLLIALIDYDNVRSIRPERNLGDVAQNLESIAEQAVLHMSTNTGATEVVLRLYGGWTDRGGRYTQQAEWVLTGCQQIRGLRRRVRVLPELAISLASVGGYTLKGLFRRNGSAAEQKMVDTVMCCDAVYLARGAAILLMSDDDDVMIGSLAASTETTQSIHLLRRRASGTALNDSICLEKGIKIFQIP